MKNYTETLHKEWRQIEESVYGPYEEIKIPYHSLPEYMKHFVREVFLNPMYEVYYPTKKIILI
jgi:hypothetical protein